MRMRDARRLKYGQTPWDRLSRKELLLLLCRYHSALSSAASCLRMSRVGSEDHPYFGPDGSAGHAIAKADFIMRLAGEDMDAGSEKIYRQFFRSATSVLFPGVPLNRGLSPWYICETCGQMLSGSVDPPSRLCKCDGAWRPFRMSDIRPDLAKAAESLGGGG